MRLSFDPGTLRPEDRYVQLSGLDPLGPIPALPAGFSPLNSILVQVESLRCDAVDAECNAVPVMPNLRALAADSLWFTRAYGPSTHTSYAEPAILSGLFPLRQTELFTYRAEDSTTRPTRRRRRAMLATTDRLLGALLDELRRSGNFDRTILAIMGDHGEAFHEHRTVTHRGLPCEEKVLVALVVHFPLGGQSPRKIDYPMALTDVVPTILAGVGMPRTPAFQGDNGLLENLPIERRVRRGKNESGRPVWTARVNCCEA